MPGARGLRWGPWPWLPAALGLATLECATGQGNVLQAHPPQTVRLLHITDSHISLSNEAPPRSSRMYSAFVRSHHRDTKIATTPQQEFARLVQMARDPTVDLVVLGGDIVNFPCNKTVTWVLEQLRLSGKDFIYTSGNHDWLLEGQRSAPRYDAARVEELSSTFRPLYEQSVTSGGSCYSSLGHWTRPGAGILYGCAQVKGLLILVVDNSNYQVDEDQLEFVRLQLASAGRNTPVVILLHIPLMLPGMTLVPKESCCHPKWGPEGDELWQLEGRPKWPTGNLPSTTAFKELMQSHASPQGQIVAILTGHTHSDAAVALGASSADSTCVAGENCRTFEVESEGGREAQSQDNGALQYTTHTAAEGAYRILTVRS
eukprot:TRINITY_DN63814_c0_g1_i1.p1 TRINITY_DN63814_c0_g1~~TRINITY_DN63814_c0_g1_i1.p1  ORF type:complete len:373 (+),score=41.38 TRINITY_DN63814_c0_g1_i1:23-1141(+)